MNRRNFIKVCPVLGTGLLITPDKQPVYEIIARNLNNYDKIITVQYVSKEEPPTRLKDIISVDDCLKTEKYKIISHKFIRYQDG